MGATVVLIRGHKNTLFQRAVGVPSDDTVSWDPDESDQHADHAALNPGCAKCVVATGDWKLVEPDSKPDAPSEPQE